MESPQLFTSVIIYIILLFVISVHEWAHAWTAYKCGDSTAKFLGRMTWNPIAHISMVGTVIIPLIGIFGPALGLGLPFAIVGWGKPVPVNPNNYNNYVRDDVLVSLAGPLSNVVITIVALIIVKILTFMHGELVLMIIRDILFPLAQLSFFLAFFNLIPFPPLDGSHILRPLLGYNGRKILDKMSAYGFIILIIFINTPVFDIIVRGINKLFMLIVKLFKPIVCSTI